MRTTPAAKRTTVAELHQTSRKAMENDLDSIVRHLAGEFGQLGGMRLLLTGGAGFPGCYFVDSNVTPDDGKFFRA